MRMMKVLVSFLLNMLVLNTNICSVLAAAPTTPKILFTSVRDGNYGVYTMNPDGSEQVNLTDHRANDLNAVWSPTGEQILFVSDRGGRRDLYRMNADGSKVRRVFKFKIDEWRTDPTWSPDGEQFAYMQINWDKDIFAIHISNFAKPEANFLANGLRPAWAPDGAEIACTVFGGPFILINVRTGTQKRILPKKELGGQMNPSWSAMGDKLAFSWNNNPLPPDFKPGDKFPEGWMDKRTIYIANRDGTGLKQIVDEAGPDADYPALSPNGEEVLYTQSINGRLQIFKLEINSGVRTQLTHTIWNLGGDWFDPAYALPVSPQPQLLTTIWGKLKQE